MPHPTLVTGRVDEIINFARLRAEKGLQEQRI